MCSAFQDREGGKYTNEESKEKAIESFVLMGNCAVCRWFIVLMMWSTGCVHVCGQRTLESPTE